MSNRYTKALKILKSKELNEKLKSLDEDSIPTNNTGLFSRYSAHDVDQLELMYSDVYWSGGDRENFQNTTLTNFGQDFLEVNPLDTSGFIGEDGTVYAELPPNSENFILGPIVDGFVSDGLNSYTNIGYIQKDTRQFVLLARIDGQWKESMNGDYPIWNGSLDGLTIYNENFTIEMAQWIQDKINNNKYAKNVPYFYSGIGNQLQEIDCPNCPPNMKGGNGIAPIELDGKNNVFTVFQIEKIKTSIDEFMKDSLFDLTKDCDLGKLARGMSEDQIKELFKIANKKLGK